MMDPSLSTGSPGSAAHAQAVLAAQMRLRAALDDGITSELALEILLFLFARDSGSGIPTSLCCEAIAAPRSTALRWISALVAGGLVMQAESQADRRVTLLSLSPKSRAALTDWLHAIADVREPRLERIAS